MRYSLTPYDWLLARRALALGAVLAAVLALIIVSTDETGATIGQRLAILSSVVALAGGVAAFVISEQARVRGELRGLGAIGVAPERAPLGAALGGLIVAALGPVLVSTRIVDLNTLYPRVSPAAGTWVAAGPGAWRRVCGSVIVRGAGELDVSGVAIAEKAVSSGEISRLWTCAALLAFAIAVPIWAIARAGVVRRLFVALSVTVCSVTLFHLVAVGRAPSALLVVPPLALLLDAWVLRRRGAWS